MLALPPPRLGSAVALALGVGGQVGSLRYAGRTAAGRAMRSDSEFHAARRQAVANEGPSGHRCGASRSARGLEVLKCFLSS